MAEKSTSNSMKVLRTDNGKEFLNREVKEILERKGIIHETTVPYTPEQNGKAERDIRTLVEAARSMLNGSKLDKELWAEAVNMAVYVLNRTSRSHTEGKTPYQVWEDREFDVHSLKMVFGSEVVHIPKAKRLKWDPKGEKGIFVGYEKSKGSRIFYPDKRTVEIKRDVVPLHKYISDSQKEEKQKNSDEVVVLLDLQENSEQQERQEMHPQRDDEWLSADEQDLDEYEHEEEKLESLGNINEQHNQHTEVRKTRAGRPIKKPERYNYDLGMVATQDEPRTYEEAMESKDALKWKEAISNELAQLQENGNWIEVQHIPDGEEVISSKWVFKKKENAFKERSKQSRTGTGENEEITTLKTHPKNLTSINIWRRRKRRHMSRILMNLTGVLENMCLREWYISYRGPCLPELKATPLIPNNVVSRAKFWAPFDQTTEIWMLNRKYSTVLQN